MARELLDIVHFESQVRQIGADDDRAALVKFAQLNLLFAARRFEEDQLRPAPGSVPARFFKTEDVSIKRNGFLEIGHAIARVQETFDHPSPYYSLDQSKRRAGSE